MNVFVRTALATASIAAPISIGANAAAALSDDPFDQIPVGFGTLFIGGGTSIAGLAIAGVAALNPAWRGAAPIAAGIGVGLLASTAAGLATHNLITRPD